MYYILIFVLLVLYINIIQIITMYDEYFIAINVCNSK